MLLHNVWRAEPVPTAPEWTRPGVAAGDGHVHHARQWSVKKPYQAMGPAAGLWGAGGQHHCGVAGLNGAVDRVGEAPGVAAQASEGPSLFPQEGAMSSWKPSQSSGCGPALELGGLR